ncbi:MAG TPA: FHA domain-containing protein, partial [Chloroflexota bacterium]|nr:FHA domain-containing protein [Chloroflexota bacterium]
MVEALQKHVYEAPPPPRSVRAELPRELEAVILRCLAKRPDERYATAAELGAALGNVLASAPPPRPAPRVPARSAPADPDASSPYAAVDRAVRAEPAVESSASAPRQAPSGAAGGAPGLVVTDARGRARTVGALSGTSTSIGREPDNDVVLPDQRVSRHHVRIDWDGGSALVTDLASGNGTWLDETRLPPNAPQPWRPGAALTVGPFQMRLAAGSAATMPGGLSSLTGVANSGVTSLEFPPLDDEPPSAGRAGRVGGTEQPGRARLLLLDSGGQQKDTIELSEGATLVGRGEENQVALRERAVSRRHVRIEWDGRQATVTDLGSDNGTWLGPDKLTPNTPQPWPVAESVRVGPYHLRLDVAAPAARVSGTAVGRVQMIVDEPALVITPGSPAIVRGAIANLGNIVDHVWVEAQGVPKEWVTGAAMSQVENQMLQLNPGAQSPVVLTVNVPRTPESLAGEYHVRLIARSRANPEEMGLAQLTWTVLPFTGCAVALDRVRSTGRRGTTVGVTVRNDGNTPGRYSLNTVDPERRLEFRFDQTVVDVEPGKAATVPLRIRAPWHWLGAPLARAFSVGLHPSEGEAPAPAAGEFLQIAVIPQWLPKAAAALIPLALIGAILLQSWIVGLLRPRILSFGAPASVVAGEPVTVSWSVERAQRVQVEGLDTPADVTPTPLGPTGRQVIEPGPDKDLQLKLVAANVFGPSESSRTVAVLTRTPPPA